MKLDNEHVYQNPSLVNKQDSKPVGYDMDMDFNNELKSGNGIIVKEKHDLWDNNNNNNKMDLFEKDSSIYYTDKSVIECELPELMVCYKESSFNVVKDIPVDDGVPTPPDTFLFDDNVVANDVVVTMEKDYGSENPEENIKISVCETDPTVSKLMKRNEKDDDTAVKVTSTDIDTLQQHDLLSSSTERSSEEGAGITTLSGSESSLVIENMKNGTVESSGNTMNEVYAQGDVLSLEELKMEPSCIGNDQLEEESSDQRSSSGSEILSSSAFEETNNNNDTQGANSLGPVLVSTGVEQNASSDDTNLAGWPTLDESKDSSLAVIDSTYDSKVETTTSFDSRAVASKLVDQSLVGSEQPVSSHPRDCMGETSFSSVGPVSGLITYSGPIAYSGNLSIRSDSSTTSTRSFAFPVLMNEWNSSPVRMVKAERRHDRKRRGWIQRFFCCRF